MDVLEGSVSAAILLVSSTPTFAQAETNASYAVTDRVALPRFVGHGITVETRNADTSLNGQRLQTINSDAFHLYQALGEERRLTSMIAACFSSPSIAATISKAADMPGFGLGALSDAVTKRDLKSNYRYDASVRNLSNRRAEFVAAASTEAASRTLKSAIVHDALVGKTVAGYQAKGTRETTSVVDTLPQSASSVDVTL
jgi:branched-chain amino acid transport system substrate-binding protein